jgi:hypothetical protein
MGRKRADFKILLIYYHLLSFFGEVVDMSGESRKSAKAKLAFAIAQGVSIAKWARANEVAAQTAFRWAREPAVRKAVETYRRRTIDEALGRMSKNTAWAADGIVTIAKHAESDALRFRACRAIFSDMMTVAKFSDLENRIGELQDHIQRGNGASNTAWSQEPAGYGQGTSGSAARPVAPEPVAPGHSAGAGG